MLLRGALLLPALASAVLIQDLGVYTSTESIASRVNQLVTSGCGGHASLWEHPQAATANAQVVRLTTPSTSQQQKLRLLISYGTYGREYMLGDLALRLMETLCDGSAASHAFLNATDMMLVPVLNTWSRRRLETSLDAVACRDLRKNSNGVDINRNFDVQWSSSSDNPLSPEYRGPNAGSEAETMLLMALNVAHRPHIFVDMHAGDDENLAHAWNGQPDAPANAADAERLLAYVDSTALCAGGAAGQ